MPWSSVGGECGAAGSPRRLKSQRSANGPDLLGQLSPRDREIFSLVAQGFTNQPIADQLGISIKSVKTYRAKVLEKLGLRSRVDLIPYALSCGVLTSGNPSL